MYSVQTFREAVPEFECRESIIAQNSRCGLVSLAEIEYENRDALLENRDALIENRDALIENRVVVIANRVSILDSILDSRFMQGSRIECQLTFERYCIYTNCLYMSIKIINYCLISTLRFVKTTLLHTPFYLYHPQVIFYFFNTFSLQNTLLL